LHLPFNTPWSTGRPDVPVRWNGPPMATVCCFGAKIPFSTASPVSTANASASPARTTRKPRLMTRSVPFSAFGLVSRRRARDPDEAMADVRTPAAPSLTPAGRLDRARSSAAQAAATPGETDWGEGAIHRGRLRVRSLVTQRWLILGGEALL